MPINKQLQALGSLDLVQGSSKGGSLGSVALLGTLVVLGARGSGSTARGGPLDGPVAVDVAAYAGGAGVGLAVLAPQAGGGLGEDEAVRVDDREDVELVLVDEGLDGGVGGVVGQEVPGLVLGDLMMC